MLHTIDENTTYYIDPNADLPQPVNFYSDRLKVCIIMTYIDCLKSSDERLRDAVCYNSHNLYYDEIKKKNSLQAIQVWLFYIYGNLLYTAQLNNFIQLNKSIKNIELGIIHAFNTQNCEDIIDVITDLVLIIDDCILNIIWNDNSFIKLNRI